MFAVGHIALGYILGRVTADYMKTRIKFPLLFTLTILPDIDLVIPGIRHRGPTHSIILMVILSLPFLVAYGRIVIPYIMAAAQHSIIGDYLTGGGIQLLWPIDQTWYGRQICPESSISIILEWTCFAASIVLFFIKRDVAELLSPHPVNLILIIPLAAIISPLFLGFPIRVPVELWVPHIIYLLLLAASIISDLKIVV